jgi:hypothetical protein
MSAHGSETLALVSRDNEIDGTVLRSLTAEDLKDLAALWAIAASCSTLSLVCTPVRP